MRRCPTLWQIAELFLRASVQSSEVSSLSSSSSPHCWIREISTGFLPSKNSCQLLDFHWQPLCTILKQCSVPNLMGMGTRQGKQQGYLYSRSKICHSSHRSLTKRPMGLYSKRHDTPLLCGSLDMVVRYRHHRCGSLGYVRFAVDYYPLDYGYVIPYAGMKDSGTCRTF